MFDFNQIYLMRTYILLYIVSKSIKFFQSQLSHRATLISDSIWLTARQQPKLQDHGHGTSVSHDVPVYSPAYAGTIATKEKCINDLGKVTLKCTAVLLEPAFSNRQSNTSPSHYLIRMRTISYCFAAGYLSVSLILQRMKQAVAFK